MSINELVKIVPPPEKPREAGTDQEWKSLQKRLGLYLPNDYRDFGMTYGSGEFNDGSIHIYNPFSKSFLKILESESSRFQMTEQFIGKQPFQFYPAQPGLLPFGHDVNGNDLFWFTQGEPDSWPIILRDRECTYETWEVPMTTFLAKAFKNEIKPLIWKQRFSKNRLDFTPSKK